MTETSKMGKLKIKQCFVKLKKIENENNPYYIDYLRRTKKPNQLKSNGRILTLNDSMFRKVSNDEKGAYQPKSIGRILTLNDSMFGKVFSDEKGAKELKMKRLAQEALKLKKLKQECLVRKCFVRLERLSKTELKTFPKHHKKKKKKTEERSRSRHRDDNVHKAKKKSKKKKEERSRSKHRHEDSKKEKERSRSKHRSSNKREKERSNSKHRSPNKKEKERSRSKHRHHASLIEKSRHEEAQKAVHAILNDVIDDSIAKNESHFNFGAINTVLNSSNNLEAKVKTENEPHSTTKSLNNNVFDVKIKSEKGQESEFEDNLDLIADLKLCQDIGPVDLKMSPEKELLYSMRAPTIDEHLKVIEDAVIEPVAKKSLKDYLIQKSRHEEAQKAVHGILNDVIRDLIATKLEGPTRWYCPICSRFDQTRGVLDEEVVKRHIVHRHGEYILDLDPLSGTECPFCPATKFADFHRLNYHLAYDHRLLLHKVRELSLDPMDYLPMPFDRCGKKIKYY